MLVALCLGIPTEQQLFGGPCAVRRERDLAPSIGVPQRETAKSYCPHGGTVGPAFHPRVLGDLALGGAGCC